MRILLVGNAQSKLNGAGYYTIEQKLMNGFIRNLHHVTFFADRDVARQATILRSSRVGRKSANKIFYKTACGYQPDLIVFFHSCLIEAETFAAIREKLPNLMIAQICVDILAQPSNIKKIQERAEIADASFITTAGPILKRFVRPDHHVAYIPNPVDASIETGRAFEHSDQFFDVFWAARAHVGEYDNDPRIVVPLHLEKSAVVKIDYHGFNGKPPLFGPSFFRHMANSKMALNINANRLGPGGRASTTQEAYLYNSDRLAQTMGSGLMSISMRTNKLYDMFEEGREMVFADTADEMLDVVCRYKKDDAARRRIAEAGWRRSHEQLNSSVVARFIEEVTFRRPLSQTYGWPSKIWS